MKSESFKINYSENAINFTIPASNIPNNFTLYPEIFKIDVPLRTA